MHNFNMKVSVVSVGTGSTQLVAPNDNRRFLALENLGAVAVSITTSGTAVAATGCLLAPFGTQGMAMRFDEAVPINAIQAIVNSGTVAMNVAVLEGF